MGFVLTDRLVALHDQGDINCRQGWCSPDSDGTPVPYVHSCGGVVHGDLLSQSSEPASWELQIGCDGCDFAQTYVQTPSESFIPKQAPASLQPRAEPVKAAKKSTRKSTKRAASSK